MMIWVKATSNSGCDHRKLPRRQLLLLVHDCLHGCNGSRPPLVTRWMFWNVYDHGFSACVYVQSFFQSQLCWGNFLDLQLLLPYHPLMQSWTRMGGSCCWKAMDSNVIDDRNFCNRLTLVIKPCTIVETWEISNTWSKHIKPYLKISDETYDHQRHRIWHQNGLTSEVGCHQSFIPPAQECTRFPSFKCLAKSYQSWVVSWYHDPHKHWIYENTVWSVISSSVRFERICRSRTTSKSWNLKRWLEAAPKQESQCSW